MVKILYIMFMSSLLRSRLIRRTRRVLTPPRTRRTRAPSRLSSRSRRRARLRPTVESARPPDRRAPVRVVAARTENVRFIFEFLSKNCYYREFFMLRYMMFE